VSERLPPQNMDAERSVLGSMLRDNGVIDDVTAIVRAEHFYTDAHQKIFLSLVALHDGGKPADMVTLADLLHERKQLDDVGRHAYLGELWDAAPTAGNAEYYARIVRDKGVLRALIHLSNDIQRDAYDETQPAEEAVEEASGRIFALAESLVRSGGLVSASQAVGAALDAYDRWHASGFSGAPTGLLDLDAITAGMRDGELIILAARTSVGKTALGLQIARHVAGVAGGVFVASLEMGHIDLGGRLIVAEAGLDSYRWQRGSLLAEQIEMALSARKEFGGLPLYIDDSTQTFRGIAAAARRVKRLSGLRLIVVDYLQLVPSQARNRYEELGEVTRRLKALAKELAYPVLDLAQLSRAAETSDKPLLSHLRESGNLEQDADVVWLMYQDKTEEGTVKLDVAKNRNGRKGGLKLVFLAKHCRFENYAGTLPYEE